MLPVYGPDVLAKWANAIPVFVNDFISGGP